MPKDIYILGVGGVAMATLAVMLKNAGFTVNGSDQKLYPPMSDYLASNQIEVWEGFKAENIQRAQAELHIVGNVISRGNPEIEEILKKGLEFTSMPEFLKNYYLKERKSIVIAGTHGKSTTTAMVAQILEVGGLSPGFFVGGLPGNFSVSARTGESGGYFAIEGDEYDTAFYDKRAKFFHYVPHFFLVNNLEFDHGDIYPNLESIIQAFRLGLRLIPPQGQLILNGDAETVMGLKPYAYCPVVTFGFSSHNDAVIRDMQPKRGQFGYSFILDYKGQSLFLETSLPGAINVSNAAASAVIALLAGIEPEKIQQGLKAFIPTRRRLEILFQQENIILVDDFAHHPTAIQAGIAAIRQHFPEHDLVVAYEPRSNTSLRKFHQNTLGTSFAGAQEAHLFKTAKLNSLPEADRLDFPAVLQAIETKQCNAFVYQSIPEMLQYLKKPRHRKTIYCLMSQGDFGGLTHSLLQHFQHLG